MASTRAGIVQAKANEDSFNIFLFQVAMTSIAVGVSLQSWWFGIAAFVGLLFLVSIKTIGTIVAIALGFLSGIAVMQIAEKVHHLGPGGKMAILLIAAAIFCSANLNSIQMAKDMERK